MCKNEKHSEQVPVTDNAQLTFSVNACGEYIRLALCWGAPRHSSSSYGIPFKQAKDLIQQLTSACSSIEFEGAPGFHDNIQCYVRDLMNNINSPLVRDMIDKIIPSLSQLEMFWAHSAAMTTLDTPWDNELIDSLLESLDQPISAAYRENGE